MTKRGSHLFEMYAEVNQQEWHTIVDMTKRGSHLFEMYGGLWR
jgi:hypothetical protein